MMADDEKRTPEEQRFWDNYFSSVSRAFIKDSRRKTEEAHERARKIRESERNG